MIRKCNDCQLELEETLFPNVWTRASGEKVTPKVCKKCSYTKEIIRYEERRIWLTDLKKSLLCLHCGSSDFRVFEFHHRDPLQKEARIALLMKNHCGKERILAEIAKCDCLCANCHRILHYEEKEEARRKRFPDL